MSPQHLNSQMVTTVATCTGSLRLASMNRVLFSLSLFFSAVPDSEGVSTDQVGAANGH